jgi:hypothetical protein
MAAVGEHAERRLYEKRDDPGQRERDPDLEIAQPERLPDLRPGSLSGAVQELIEELNGEENGDGAGSTSPAPARGFALAGRARKAHVLEPTGASAAWKGLSDSWRAASTSRPRSARRTRSGENLLQSEGSETTSRGPRTLDG